jgi:hypothetical protein
LRGDGDELDAELGAGAFEGATELAAVVDLDAADGVGPALKAFAKEAFGGAAGGATVEARVRELAFRVDGAEVVAGLEGAVLVQGVDLDELAGLLGAFEGALAAGVRACALRSPAALGSPAEPLDATACHQVAQHPPDGAGADDHALAGQQDGELVLAARVQQAKPLDGFANLAPLPGVAMATTVVATGERAHARAPQDAAPTGVRARADAEDAAGLVAGDALPTAFIDPGDHQRARTRLGWNVARRSRRRRMETAGKTEYSHVGGSPSLAGLEPPSLTSPASHP